MLHQNFAESDAAAAPDYLLVCRAQATELTHGSWYFALESATSGPVFEAGDEDQGDLNRLTLLAAVRGLESIDGPASVTLLSSNRYLIRSLADSLPRWRATDFVWEHFGRRIDVQHADLWRRIDRALSIHRVEACLLSSRLVSAGQRAASQESVQNAVGHQQVDVAAAESLTDSTAVETDAADSADRSWVRFDDPHPTGQNSIRANQPTSSVPTAGPPRPRRRGSRPATNRHWQGPWTGEEELQAAVAQDPETPRTDPLRKWLLRGDRPDPRPAPRRRFTAADLLESA